MLRGLRSQQAKQILIKRNTFPQNMGFGANSEKHPHGWSIIEKNEQ